MKKHSDRSLDKFTQKWLKDIPLESPSEEFTKQVLEQIEVMPLPVRYSYRPPISKMGWALFISVLSISIIAAYIFDLQPLGIFEKVSIWNPEFEGWEMSFIPKMDWSNPWLYSTVAFGLLMLLQLKLLKPMIESRTVA